MKKCVKLNVVLISVVLSLFIQMLWVQPYWAVEVPSMYSAGYALTDGSTNRLLLGKKETDPMANASTTKILTCIVTLENSSLDESVTISSNAQNQPKVRLGMGEGEQYPLVDLLYGLMLESYNDCAVAIAEHVAGSEEGFAKLMNKKAKEIGCLDTYFITPNGLDEENETNFHHTTAQDLCRIMAYCVWESPQKDMFLQITQTSLYQGSNGKNNYTFANKNAFLNQMDGVLSGKTGYTAKAGYCYVAALEQDGERYCIALLACGWPNHKTYKWKDARALFDFGLKNYENATIESCNIEETIVIDGFITSPQFRNLNERMEIRISGEVCSSTILLNRDEKIKRKIVMEESVDLPIEKGKVLGNCYLYVGDYLISTIPLTAKYNCDKWDFHDVLKTMFRQYVDF